MIFYNSQNIETVATKMSPQYETRKEENQQSTEAYKRDQERAAISELIAKKKQHLEDLSIDELEAKLKNIG